MKSIIFNGKHDLRLKETEVPKAGRGEVVIKVMVCGICGTNVQIYV